MDDATCKRRMRHGGLLAAFLAALVAAFLMGVPATSASINPDDFEVNVGDIGPDFKPQPECTQLDSGKMRCTLDDGFSSAGKKATGTVRHAKSGLEGSIYMTCDMNMSFKMTVVVTPPSGPGEEPGPEDITYEEFSGNGQQTCSWHMEFNDGESTMTGVMEGTMTMSLNEGSSPATKHFKGEFSVTVVAATGLFENNVGSGSWTEESDSPVNEEPREPGKNKGSAASIASIVGASAEKSPMKIKLRNGKPIAKIVLPKRRISSKDAYILRVATMSGAKCRASARSRGKRVDLGSASVRRGNATFRGKLSRKLGKGKWNVSANCSYSYKGKSGTTHASKSLLVA